MPPPLDGGVTVSENKLWSGNTSRGSKGTMYGTLVAIKTKVEIQWPPLTMAKYAVVEAAASKAWPTVSWVDKQGVTASLVMYSGDLSGSYSAASGIPMMRDVSLSIIEK